MTAPPTESSHKEMRWFAWSLAAIILTLAVLAALSTMRADRPIVVTTSTAEDLIPEVDPVQVLETSWKDVDNVTHTVKTPRLADETLDAWTARHQAAVAALQAIYPPV